MRVHVIRDPADMMTAARDAAPPQRTPQCWGPWRPTSVLGASSAGGLRLPDARPSAATLYAPRGVLIDEQRIIVCDTGNHRVLIWDEPPQHHGAAAAVVLAQPDPDSEGPAAGGRGPENGLHLPTGVCVDQGRLIVADAWHHRIVVWNAVPRRSDTPPDHVIGQQRPSDTKPNAGGQTTAATLYWPFGVAVIDGRFYVTDTGNRRVLVWRGGLPLDGRPADVVLGQPDSCHRDENRGGEVGPASFRWPHAIAKSDQGLLVADAGNHRILGWRSHPERDTPADIVIGQPDFATATEFPYQSQEGRLRFPYGLAAGDGIAVADTANNRVLLWEAGTPLDDAPDAALGQHDFAGAGENRWDAVTSDTLCWPYGISRRGDLLAIADSGNNRVVIWAKQGGH